jgi:hypothetical protein
MHKEYFVTILCVNSFNLFLCGELQNTIKADWKTEDEGCPNRTNEDDQGTNAGNQKIKRIIFVPCKQKNRF